MRLMTLARALWCRDEHALQHLPRHLQEFVHFVEEGLDDFESDDAARFESVLAEDVRRGAAQRARRSG